MKRRDLLARLRDEGCVLVRTVGSHDWYRNVITGACQPVPRHREIKEFTARAIIKKLSTAPAE
ncbi:MAG: type II toxin-antitoxin system HicA family toxin [Kiritimatiellae bacterium]|nr:type II toxin-antitoxin system HicA family toxin [Kiritimatiellia bacterium]MBQ6328653.1 type II toxin-antitoxin system HicA family toxin [Kiritimatiellia bacterium]